jgi:hypothetical protein
VSDLLYLVPLFALYLLSLVVLLARIRPPELGPNPPRFGEAAAGPAAREMRLVIEGTDRPQLRSTRFVGHFGLDAKRVRDIRVYEHGGELESFPARLIALLFRLYEEGALRGADAMALLFHGRPLGDGEALYFALVDLPPEPSVVAFIDRRQAPAPGAPARARTVAESRESPS